LRIAGSQAHFDDADASGVVLERVQQVACDTGTTMGGRDVHDVHLGHAVPERDQCDAPDGLASTPRHPEPTDRAFEDGGIEWVVGAEALPRLDLVPQGSSHRRGVRRRRVALGDRDVSQR
jgi:hypothetical protein